LEQNKYKISWPHKSKNFRLYLDYSGIDFGNFRPAEETHCTEWSKKNWRVWSIFYAKFHPHRCRKVEVEYKTFV